MGKNYYSIILHRFFFLVVYFTIFSSFAQSKIDIDKRKKFYALKNEYEFSVNFSKDIGEKMISYAQDDYEKAMAYVILGENYYNKSNFVESVSYLEKSLSFVNKTDSLDFKVRILNVLVISYRRAGLISESDENWKLLQKISSNLPSRTNKANLLYTQTKIYDIDEDYCKAAVTRRAYYNIIKEDESVLEIRNRFNFAILSQLGFELIKCGKFNDAQQVIYDCELLLKGIATKDPILLYEFHLMNKALIVLKKGHNDSARLYFDEALRLNKIDNNKSIKKVLLNERVNAKIDPAEDQLTFLTKVAAINNSENLITKSLTAKETDRKISIIKQKQRNERALISSLIILALGTIGVLFYFSRRNKKLRAKYTAIIKDLNTGLKNNPNPVTFEEIFVDHIIQEEVLEDETAKKAIVQISEETEKEFLKNLEIFEKKKLYTTKGLSATQMAVMLKTNTKYLSALLKKFRNNDFYNYINEQRISYIVKMIYENRKYLNYKIAVLSDMCGYNTHSQFASAFKQIKGISPSKFIQFLKEEEQNLIKNP